MNIMAVLDSKNAFSDALESVVLKNFLALPSRVYYLFLLCKRCYLLIAYAIYKILRALVCTQELSYWLLSLLHCFITVNGK